MTNNVPPNAASQKDPHGANYKHHTGQTTAHKQRGCAMDETQHSATNSVVEEQRVIAQALDVLLDIHHAEERTGYPLDYGVHFLCHHTILNHHEPVVRKAWDEFYDIYNLEGDN